jgi:hypothetical protein
MREFVPHHARPVKRPPAPSRGAASAITRPVLAPTVEIHGAPVVRTENASCVGNTSISVFTFGS